MMRFKFIIIILLIITYWPLFTAGFLQLDDPQHVFMNPDVSAPLPEALWNIFTHSVNKIYLPLTTLSFSIEHHFFGFHPFVFHLTNLLLHGSVTILIMALLRQWGFNAVTSFFAAIIFAIHPMKTESVAWITERKDVLYALFYIGTLFVYTHYIQRPSLTKYAGAILLAVLSLLSKPMAISLPLILLWLDWYLRRQFTIRTFLEKIPFVFVAAGIGWITYAQNMRNPITDIGSAVLIWIWSFSFYIWKFFYPWNVAPFYKLPQPVSILNFDFAVSTLFFIILLSITYLWRHRRIFIFALGFYILSIFFLLRFDIGVDASVVNDRFMYLPGLGFCILLGLLFTKLFQTRFGQTIVTIIIITLVLITHHQCRIWQSTLTFYTEVIRAYPDAFTGYSNRAHYYYSTGQLSLALADYSKAIAINPGFARNYIGRGTIYGLLNDPAKAIEDFSTALKIDPTLAEGYFNRSIAKNQAGYYQEALDDAQQSRKLGIPLPAEYENGLQSKLKPLSP